MYNVKTSIVKLKAKRPLTLLKIKNSTINISKIITNIENISAVFLSNKVVFMRFVLNESNFTNLLKAV